MMALTSQGSWKDEMHKAIRTVPGPWNVLSGGETF